MSDDLNRTIKQITDILGQESMPDNVKTLLSLLASGSDKGSPPEHSAPAAREELSEEKNDRVYKTPEKTGAGNDRIMRRALELMNTRDDPKVNLLMAIKPFLNNSRQKNLNNCIKIANLTKVLSLLDEFQDGKD